MYEHKKKIGTVLTSKSVGTGTSSYEKRIYQAAVSQRLRNTAVICRGLLRNDIFPHIRVTVQTLVVRKRTQFSLATFTLLSLSQAVKRKHQNNYTQKLI